jgi:hypothetical protein
VSADASFTQDASIARVIARLDCGLNDARGLVSVAATTQAASDRASKK